jgi:predicted DNA-binding transcriptional regulator YafY
VQRKRLVADRLRRVWRIAEYVAYHPGCSRSELAERFAIAERTLQADLNTMRQDMGLPLVRRDGYRFLAEPESAAVAFGFGEAYLLTRAVGRLGAEGAASADAVQALAAKLPRLFPPHLRPLLAYALSGVAPGWQDADDESVAGVLARALQRGAMVYLRYATGGATGVSLEIALRPEVVVPYHGGWYVIGECQDTRKVRVVALAAVEEARLLTGRRAR